MIRERQQAVFLRLLMERPQNAREEFEYNTGVCWPAERGCANVQSRWIVHGLD